MRALLSLLSPAGPRGRLSILIFHRVMPTRDPLFPGEVTAVEFDAICGWLRAWFNVMPLGEAASALAERRLPARALAITFDDGYADNHDIALPILRHHGLTATFFIATGYLDGGRMWNDTVVEALRRCPQGHLDLAPLGVGLTQPLPLGSDEERRAAVHLVLPALKYLGEARRLKAAQAIAAAAGTELPDTLMMSSDQVRALHRAGMGIGAHTVSHPILRGLPAAQVRREIDDNRRSLVDLVREPVGLFAYPNGRPGQDYDDETVAVVRELGFEAAVTTAWRPASQKDNQLELPRFMPWERSRWRFGARMAQALWSC